MKKRSAVVVVVINVLLNMINLTPSEAFAQDIHLDCGGAQIRLICEAGRDSQCEKSRVEFSSLRKKKVIVKSPREVDESIIPDGIACLGAGGKEYVIVRFSNGGECGDCMFYDLFMADGDALSRRGRGLDGIMAKLGLTGARFEFSEFGR